MASISDGENGLSVRNKLNTLLGYFNDTNPALTLTSGTVTASTPPLNVTQTWNSGGVTFTGLKLNVTDTASASASLLQDWQVASSSVFSMRKDGRFSVGTGYLEATTLALSGDAFLIRSAANVLALRNGTSAQTLLINNTYTDASNYERGKIEWASNVFRIGTEKAGTGSARALELQTDGTTRLTIGGTGTITLSGGIGLSSSGTLSWSGRSVIASPANSILQLRNNAGTDFYLLQFGGATSAEPSIKRSTTILQARLADDSGFATFQGKLRADVNAVAETPTATHTITITDAAGTSYKLLCVAA